MSIPPLPVPELDQTLERFLGAAEALLEPAELEPAELETARQQAEALREHDGPRLQAMLRDFAAQEEAQGRSWLSRPWLDSYLAVRDPLPLSTSVGFQITGDYGLPGADRAAQLLHRAAAIHLQAVTGQTPPESNPRGQRMSPEQWDALRGGLRHPRPGADEIRRPSIDPRQAEVGVVHRGHLHALRITDDDGRVLAPQVLATALRRILSAPRSWVQAELPFGTLSVMPAQEGAEVLEQLLRSEHNRRVYDRLTRMVLQLELIDDAASDEEHLQRLTFQPSPLWVRKPLSYEVGLADEWMGVHVEHSTIDGATLLAALGRMQRVEIPESASAPAQEVPAADPLDWQLEGDQRQRLAQALIEHRRAAAPFRISSTAVPRLDPQERPFRISDDAAQQLILTCAQLHAFGQVRSVYEAVDMRSYRAGRTECLRPVTPEAVQCAAALLDSTATQEQLTAALDAHRAWVKACKSGSGPDRHLMGLTLMAQQAQVRPALLESSARAAVEESFLSTTSIGTADRIVRYAFAPSVPHGFGISYTLLPEAYEFCLTTREGATEDPEAFRAGLQRGAEALWAAVRSFA